jgi:hypothetical protein
VLGDARAGRGDDEHRGGRDVERVGAIAAGADDVDEVRIRTSGGQRTRVRHARPSRATRRRSGDLANGFLLHAQAGQDRRNHRRRHLAA